MQFLLLQSTPRYLFPGTSRLKAAFWPTTAALPLATEACAFSLAFLLLVTSSQRAKRVTSRRVALLVGRRVVAMLWLLHLRLRLRLHLHLLQLCTFHLPFLSTSRQSKQPNIWNLLPHKRILLHYQLHSLRQTLLLCRSQSQQTLSSLQRASSFQILTSPRCLVWPAVAQWPVHLHSSAR